MRSLKPLILGVGNSDRGDDGAGHMAARLLGERLRDGTVEIITTHGEPSLLMDLWKDRDRVDVIDAVVHPGLSPGEWICLDGLADDLGAVRLQTSSHAMGLKEAIELGKILGGLPRQLRLWLVSGSRFDPMHPMQEIVAAGVRQLTDVLERELQQLEGAGAHA